MNLGRRISPAVGSVRFNQKLSECQAASVKTELVHDDVGDCEIPTSGVGQSDPLVVTSDGVREPPNRRAASAFLDGLLSDVARKTGWLLSEQAGLGRPYRIQSLPECWQTALETISLGCLCYPEDMAGPALFLTSPMAPTLPVRQSLSMAGAFLNNRLNHN